MQARGEGSTGDIKDKTNEAVVRRERLQDFVHEDDMLKIVNHTFPIQKVHRRREPIPIETLREAETACSRWDVGDGDNLFERDDLYSGDDQDDVDVSHGHGEEETPDHDEGPYCAGDEGLLFLFVLGGLGSL